MKTIDEMHGNGEKLNIHAVAERCGVSHSLIYNRYPDLKERIKGLKAEQRVRAEARSDSAVVAKLLAQNKVLSTKASSESSARHKAEMAALISHLHEMYAMYDQLLEDRNKLAERLRKRGKGAE
jgi:AcrR family transcriptional regulator